MEKVIRFQSIIFWDIAVIILFYMIPTLSHLTSIPFYRFEPMRCVLMLTLLLTGNKKNAYVMAITLPLFSFLVGSHPFFIKAILMAIELSINVLLFDKLSKRINNTVVSMFVAIVLSKVLYYIIKLGLLKTGFVVGHLFTTSVWLQIFIVAILALLFYKYHDKTFIRKKQ